MNGELNVDQLKGELVLVFFSLSLVFIGVVVPVLAVVVEVRVLTVQGGQGSELL